jgi:hypothetical protein
MAAAGDSDRPSGLGGDGFDLVVSGAGVRVIRPEYLPADPVDRLAPVVPGRLLRVPIGFGIRLWRFEIC